MMKLINEINSYHLTNKVIDFLSSFPLLNKIFKEFDYENLTVKDGISRFLRFIKIVLQIVLKILLYSMIYSTAINSIEFSEYNYVTIYIIFILCIGASSLFIHIFKFNKKDYLMIKLLKFDRDNYTKTILKSFLLKELIFNFISFSILFVNDIKSIIIYSLSVICIKLISEYIYLQIIKRKKSIIVYNWVVKYVYILSSFSAILLSSLIISAFFKDLSISRIYGIIFFIIILLSGLYLIYCFFNKYDFNRIYNRYLTKEVNDARNSKMTFNQINDTYRANDIKVETQKTGFDYFYELLNKRYRKNLIVKEALFILFTAGYIYIIYDLRNDSEFNSGMLFNFNNMNTILIISLLIINMMQEYFRLCYYKADKSLNNYLFYKNNRLCHIKYRIKSSFIFDFILAIIVLIGSILFKNNILESILIIIISYIFNILINCYFYYYFNLKETNRFKVLSFGYYYKLIILYICSRIDNVYICSFVILVNIFIIIYLIYNKERKEKYEKLKIC